MISCHYVKHKTHGTYVMAIVKVTQLKYINLNCDMDLNLSTCTTLKMLNFLIHIKIKCDKILGIFLFKCNLEIQNL